MFEPSMDCYWIGVFFFLGAIFGSFGNVVVLRLPKQMSIVKPASHCYACQKKINWYDNIPILSWLFLKGKCRSCGTKFSFRYCLVEIITATLFAMSFAKFGWNYILIEMLILFWGLVVVSFIDLDHFLIPDKISIPGIAIGLLGGLLNPERGIADSLAGMILGGGFLWAIAYVYFLLKKEEGMGGGDIKLLAWIGSILGWKSIAFVILCASVMGSVVGLSIIFFKNKNMKTIIPFGPYLAFAAVLFVFYGEKISDWYLSLFFPWLG